MSLLMRTMMPTVITALSILTAIHHRAFGQCLLEGAFLAPVVRIWGGAREWVAL